MSALSQTEFFHRPFVVSHDSFTYTNLPGLHAGADLANFSSPMRTPGYSVFLALVTLGEIPRPGALLYKLCGPGILGSNESCDTAVPDGAEVTARHPPVVYGYSRRDGALFQRAIFAGKLLFVASLLMLYWALSLYVAPVSAMLCAIAVAACVLSAVSGRFMDVLQTESLFPTLAVLYIAFVAMHLAGRTDRYWLVAASIVAVACFLVRPVFIFLVATHGALVVHALAVRRARVAFLASFAVVVIPVAWVFLASPIVFFSVANFQSASLRTAILSDENTVACIADRDQKIILASYLRAIASDPQVIEPLKRAGTYLSRYYVLGPTNSYRVEEATHPIHGQPEFKQLSDRSGGIKQTTYEKTFAAASRCNLWREVAFTAQTIGASFGLSQGVRPYVPSNLFNHPYAAYLSFAAVASGLALLLAQRRYPLAFVTGYAVAIHLAMVLIVAVKQGGESRYTAVTEPLFILGAAMGVMVWVEFLLSAANQRFQSRH